MDEEEIESSGGKEFSYPERKHGEKSEDYWRRVTLENLQNGVPKEVVSEVVGRIIGEKESREGRDGLTGLKNSETFWQDLEETLGEVQRSSHESSPLKLSLAIIDLDGLKEINDERGYRAGDEALRNVAQIVEETGRRAADVAVRYGGDEFCLILYNADAAGALKRAEVLKSRVEKIGSTVSVGVSTSVGGQESAEQLFDRANVAVQIAKGKLKSELVPGEPKNRVVSWQEGMPLETGRKYG